MWTGILHGIPHSYRRKKYIHLTFHSKNYVPATNLYRFEWNGPEKKSFFLKLMLNCIRLKDLQHTHNCCPEVPFEASLGIVKLNPLHSVYSLNLLSRRICCSEVESMQKWIRSIYSAFLVMCFSQQQSSIFYQTLGSSDLVLVLCRYFHCSFHLCVV